MPLCGQTLPILQEREPAPVFFAGFLPLNDFTGPGAIATGITGFTLADHVAGNWTQYHHEQLFLAKVINVKAWVVHDHNNLIELGRFTTVDTAAPANNNVVYIHKK